MRFISACRSDACWYRRSRSFSSALAIKPSSRAGTSGFRSEIGRAGAIQDGVVHGALACCRRMPAARSPSRRTRLPARTDPYGNRSPRRAPARETCRRSSRARCRVSSSRSRSRAARAEERVLPGREGAAVSLARPKSRTFTRFLSPTKMFAGLMSRCTMPCACAASSASASWMPMSSTSGIFRAPRAMRSLSVSPLRASITMKGLLAVVADVEDGADARMTERAGGARFDPKALQGRRFLGPLRGRNFSATWRPSRSSSAR